MYEVTVNAISDGLRTSRLKYVPFTSQLYWTFACCTWPCDVTIIAFDMVAGRTLRTVVVPIWQHLVQLFYIYGGESVVAPYIPGRLLVECRV